MKLTIFNGSPRGKGSNTKILMDHFMKGFDEAAAAAVKAAEGEEEQPKFKTNIAYLVKTGDMEEFLEIFEESEKIILAFPLYTDAMPGIVKHFIEQLHPFCSQENNPDIGFVVQSGFPETIHSRYVEKYLEKLAKRLGSKYLGTVIKGGVEGIQVQPSWMTGKLFDAFYRLGLHFGKTGEFDKEIIQLLAKQERMSGFARFIYRLLSLTGFTNFYWNHQLKKNNAYDQRFARPYSGT